MKKIFASFLTSFLFVAAFAQTANYLFTPVQGPYTTPRTGVYPYTSVGNTYNNLSQHFFSFHPDVAGLDSVQIQPTVYSTIYVVDSLLDSVLVTMNYTNANFTAYAGDVMEFIINNTSTGVSIHFSPAWFACQHFAAGGGTQLYPGTSKRAHIKFVFDGLYWVETERTTNLY